MEIYETLTGKQQAILNKGLALAKTNTDKLDAFFEFLVAQEVFGNGNTAEISISRCHICGQKIVQDKDGNYTHCITCRD